MGELTAALADSGIDRIVLAAGVYELDPTDVCDSDSWLCVTSAVTIEAAEAGTVVLDATGQRRVFYIEATGVELIGLNITGGYAQYVSACLSTFEPAILHRPVGVLTHLPFLVRRDM